MRIQAVDLFQISLPLKQPFTTSFGTVDPRELVIVRLEADGAVGWGECSPLSAPAYTYETVGTVRLVLEQFLIPRVLGRDFATPADLAAVFAPVRGHHMARAGLEGAFWDAWSQVRGQSLSRAVGGERQEIAVGVSVGIPVSLSALLTEVEGFLRQGYQRIKVKIKPGWDLEPVAALRRQFGDIPLMADANSAYTLADLPLLKELDQFDLMMIEQPLAHDDIIDHADLQRELRTPICLDESIHTEADAQKALRIGACRIINIKIGRVGGMTAAKAIHDLCVARQVAVWCGGMLESGVGRAHNVALTTLPGFVLPGDTSGSDRYYREDIVAPAVTVTARGTIQVPDSPGLGYNVSAAALSRYTTWKCSYRP